MKLYQRSVVALIRASGARLCVLHDHQLVHLWSRYSNQLYFCGWIRADRREVKRFLEWSDRSASVARDVAYAERARRVGNHLARPRIHLVRVWNKTLVERRLPS